MRQKYIALACFLAMISGAIFRSDKIISHDSGLTIWFWFSTISGVVLNFSFSVPSQFKIFQKSIFISGLYSISLIARDIYQLLLLSFIAEMLNVFRKLYISN